MAAVPSLHAAYPLLTLFFLVRKYKIKGLLLLPYVLGIWFAIVCFGEHYVFDIVIGAIYAILAFILVTKGSLIWQKVHLYAFR